MQAPAKYNIKSLEYYRSLFPKAGMTTTRLKRNATVFDTVYTVMDAVEEHAWQCEKFVNTELKGLPIFDALEKLWWILKLRVAYVHDFPGFDQVKTTRRTLADGYGDCDDYTFFVNCCSRYLPEIESVYNRITKYTSKQYQHIYPIVCIGKDKYVVMDVVANAFNYEEPYKTKKDYAMELQVLDGIEPIKNPLRVTVDAQDLFSEDDEMGELDGLLQNIGNGIKNAVQTVTNTVQNVGQNVVNAATNVAQTVVNTVKDPSDLLHDLNVVNPAVALLRLGFLASMKMNMAAVASNIKWAYLSKDDAVAKGIDPDKYDQLKKVMDKAQEIFYGAGGKPENLKDAILNGDGNKNHEVMAGLGYTPNQSLKYILGNLYEQNSGGLSGTGLGEVVTAAAITAAAGAIAALAGLLKNIGDIFKKKDAAAAAIPIAPEETQPVIVPRTIGPALTDGFNLNDLDFSQLNLDTPDPNTTPSTPKTPVTINTSTPTTQQSSSQPSTAAKEGDETFWSKNKNWILPVGGVVVVGGGIATAVLVSRNKKKKRSNGVAGIPKKKNNNTGKKTKTKKKSGKKGSRSKTTLTTLDLM